MHATQPSQILKLWRYCCGAATVTAVARQLFAPPAKLCSVPLFIRPFSRPFLASLSPSALPLLSWAPSHCEVVRERVS